MTTQRGLICLAGASLLPAVPGAAPDAPGAPRWARGVSDDVVVTLRGGEADGARVREALALLDDGAPSMFLLSYEACVALDPRLRPGLRKPRDAALGPDVVVRRIAPAEPPPVAAAIAGAVAGAVAGAGGAWRPNVRAPDERARAAHVQRVRTARERLLDGVIYQANLAHRLDVARASHDDGLAFFLAATAGGAPPCAAFVDVPGWGSVVSLSPERFVERDGARARAFPIKGTRPRGSTAAEDARLLAELCASAKDAAEHVMIVDLLRNDLGKVAVPGGVSVEQLLEVVSVKNVHHLESTVAARLRDGVTTSALLEATAPGGSITGAPKSSAVEVIHELEAGPRGLYTGVLGFVEGQAMRSSLLIRTWLRPDDAEGALHVGGGIVVDSEPASEWQETLDKARVMS